MSMSVHEDSPFGVILQTSLTAQQFDEASGGGGHFWLQENGVFVTTTLLPTRLATDLGLRIFSYAWTEYEGEAAMGFAGYIVSGPKDLLEMPVSGTLVRPVVPGKTILGFIYRDKAA
jgi:hypothetical protein